MSIYLVKLSEWFPPGDENFQLVYDLIKVLRCSSCGSRSRWRAAVGHHSIFVGCGDIFCGWKCSISGKTAKMDKRALRSWKRRCKKRYGVDLANSLLESNKELYEQRSNS